MQSKNNLSVIVPVYNEEKIIANVIGEIKDILLKMNIDFEIIAVNDGSRDKSGEILKNISGIRVFNHHPNRGYGASLKTGIKNAKYDWILIIDADGTYPVKEIPILYKYTKEYDMVVGARVKKENQIPFERKYAKQFLNKFASYLAGKKVPDLNSGLRIFKKEIALSYWNLFPEKFSFTSTITMVCLTHNYPVKFVPIDYHKRVGKSSIRALDFFNFWKLIVKLSLFFKPFKVFFPLSLFILLLAGIIPVLYFQGITERFLDSTFIILCATALQTFFFGLLAEIVIHNK